MAAPDTDDRLAFLVPRAQEGDKRALKEIIQIVHPTVLRYARARISGGRTPTAEDVAQEICLAVATSVNKYQDKGKPFMAFVYGIAFNKVTDAHRALSRDKSSPTDEMPDQEFSGDTPEDAAMVEVGSNRVRELLDLLSEKAREIVTLRVFVGLSAEETAEITGSTAGAVRVAQHRALATMRKAVEEEQRQHEQLG
ncbi:MULTISPECIES: sigma-70 family RNA polymerase sigma factor [unclassified Corynebacterium]|uniref:sigma-70 family RNA polymerase sigma factor n=1 Tax=unclassified Corynebacterium TaxID=2624378 RepID=UPI0021A9D40A|nr:MULTISPECIES: sigma-70 family RNA polymerase sigma factor [unclassified Corynebacterium]MCT1452032.1 sigma-70 family RNA polymerase sigma factor [Corynebacterium sp. p3-SID1145]MCT1460993.1 sigma-70 family RNA polymerase sigma factor [Corynebacterium sp. p3-SID1140]MDN8595336.1 sigma-70 family RNA polymerase sigma factor [Corynebacterium sp. P4_F2]WKK54821.1 sigma-70 family RNA polymerase sigma factor [Corynebacterium sp. P4-C1]WKK64198.1 sigma-70 family RNA polymerase sigma factor [Coryneb